jgi:hypothetical protein
MTDTTDIVLRMKTLPDLTNEQAWAVVYEGAKEIERLRIVLGWCAAPFDQSDSPPVAAAMAEARELKHRIKLAANALSVQPTI